MGLKRNLSRICNVFSSEDDLSRKMSRRLFGGLSVQGKVEQISK